MPDVAHIVERMVDSHRPLSKGRIIWRRCMERNWYPKLWGQWWSHSNHSVLGAPRDLAIAAGVHVNFEQIGYKKKLRHYCKVIEDSNSNHYVSG